MDIRQIVYKGFDNSFSLSVDKAGQAVDFTGAISFELIVAGVSITTGITSDVAGVIDFDIGLEVVPSGTHTAKLIVIDSDHPNGQVIFDANSRGVVKIKFV